MPNDIQHIVLSFFRRWFLMAEKQIDGGKTKWNYRIDEKFWFYTFKCNFFRFTI